MNEEGKKEERRVSCKYLEAQSDSPLLVRIRHIGIRIKI